MRKLAALAALALALGAASGASAAVNGRGGGSQPGNYSLSDGHGFAPGPWPGRSEGTPARRAGGGAAGSGSAPGGTPLPADTDPPASWHGSVTPRLVASPCARPRAHACAR